MGHYQATTKSLPIHVTGHKPAPIGRCSEVKMLLHTFEGLLLEHSDFTRPRPLLLLVYPVLEGSLATGLSGTILSEISSSLVMPSLRPKANLLYLSPVDLVLTPVIKLGGARITMSCNPLSNLQRPIVLEISGNSRAPERVRTDSIRQPRQSRSLLDHPQDVLTVYGFVGEVLCPPVHAPKERPLPVLLDAGCLDIDIL